MYSTVLRITRVSIRSHSPLYGIHNIVSFTVPAGMLEPRLNNKMSKTTMAQVIQVFWKSIVVSRDKKKSMQSAYSFFSLSLIKSR